jgi:radical SAM family uncharacterized protein
MSARGRETDNGYLSTEKGIIRKDWRGRSSVALAYPNYYHVGMSNLGFQTVYGFINRIEGLVCERVFLQDEENRQKGRLRSLESHRQLSDFDIIAFSISFENDYPNLLTMLGQAGLPLLSSERTPLHPLIIAGGVTSLLNPEPIASFIDCFLIGEAEALLPDFFDHYKAFPEKQVFFENLVSKVSGVYVPALYHVAYSDDGMLAHFVPKKNAPAKVNRAIIDDLSSCNTCTTIVSEKTTFENTYLMEAARGCPHGCRFCAAGYVYRPCRFRSASQLESCLDQAQEHAGQIGVVAADVAHIPDLESFCLEANNRHLNVSFSSLRADLLTPKLMEMLKRSGTKTATIAPDAGSERMRRVINKGISESDVFRAVEMIVDAGIPNLKLYFMVGLPQETMSDVEAIVELCKKIKHRFLKASRPKGRLGHISVSLNCFVPKPFTPFQWVPLENVGSLKKKIRHVKDGLRRVANVRVHADLPKWAYIQALLSRGDRRVSDLLVGIYKNNGNWVKTLKASIINTDFFVYRERSFDEMLPWDFIDHGVKKAFLIEEYEKALKGETTPACHVGQCKACGVCDQDNTKGGGLF